jgi:N-acetylglucosamine kinase-like BadF-type ATPase
MILIADSGSTKTNWALIQPGGEANFIKTDGINPFSRNVEDISVELKGALIPQINGEVSAVKFYGAGIINSSRGARIKMLLQDLFPQANIETRSDLLAAARAMCGNQQGIACILGTGSNSCQYDGEKIAEHVSPLGFILGDEGSGAVMGRILLGDYLKKGMPESLRNKFSTSYGLTRTDILESVYRKERPNLFLAGFTKFIYENIHVEYCSQLVYHSFDAFISRNLLTYTGYKSLPVHFTGSVAFYFQDILKKALTKHALNYGMIMQEPMEGLIRYHSGNVTRQ